MWNWKYSTYGRRLLAPYLLDLQQHPPQLSNRRACRSALQRKRKLARYALPSPSLYSPLPLMLIALQPSPHQMSSIVCSFAHMACMNHLPPISNSIPDPVPFSPSVVYVLTIMYLYPIVMNAYVSRVRESYIRSQTHAHAFSPICLLCLIGALCFCAFLRYSVSVYIGACYYSRFLSLSYVFLLCPRLTCTLSVHVASLLL